MFNHSIYLNKVKCISFLANLYIVRFWFLFQGRCSSESSEDAGVEGHRNGGHQTQTAGQVQVQGPSLQSKALSTGTEMETVLQEVEMQTYQQHMCSPQCSPGS